MFKKTNIIIAIVVLALLAGGYVLLTQKFGVVYRNTTFGLQVKLPDSWKGYTIITGTREIRDTATDTVVATAPTIKIRNPLWTTAKPYEDLPIEIYTPAQWAKITSEQYAVSAAPIPPTELAHNSNFIFALPARYNYDYRTGWEEVDRLIHSGIVTAF